VSSRRGVFLILAFLLFASMVSIVGVFVLSLAASPVPSVPSNAALFLPLRAPFDEVESFDLFQIVRRAPTLRETIAGIRKAKNDARVRTLIIRPEASGALWAQLQELRGALEEFKGAGKPLIAFLEAGTAQDYYVASAADRVVMMPAGQLDLSGLATYELFFRGTLDKLGVYPDLLHIGDFKTASNTFTERTFTPAHREMTQSLNRDWYDELVRAIAAGRKRTPEEIRAAIDQGPFDAEGARNAGLVDALAYEDQLDDEAPVAGTRRIEADLYARVPPPAVARATSGRIALLYAVGTIASGRSNYDSPGGFVVGSDTFVQWLRKVRVDPDVRAIVVRIDSPGGSAIASEVMWRELMLTRDIKPLIVSMGDVAASGGYYIAAPAHTIVAQPGTITGSIGVVTGKFVLEGTFDKIGVGTEAVSDGRRAEIYSPFRPFTPDERARIESQMQGTYDLFVSRVAEGRHLEASKVDAIAQGRVWTGRQAHELELVDELGGLDRALQIAKERAKLDPKREVDLLVYPPRRSIFEVLANPLGSTVRLGLTAWLERPAARSVRRVERTLELFDLFRRGEMLTLMPNVFSY
jgi:protease-4